jgi:phosphatidylinositol glycan class K
MMTATSGRATRIRTGRLSQSWRLLCFLLLCGGLDSFLSVAGAAQDNSISPPNIHAVIVASSRYWFNYRHAMNALGIYRLLHQNGIPDSQIVLMVADEYAINPRNPFKNGMYANGIKPEDTWYSEDTELDYRGSDVTVQNFFNAVLGVGPKSLQDTNEESNLLIFVTGHGGDQFFKFQDEEELTAQDIANMMEELAKRKKFGKALFIADTCQAFTLFDKITTPNVYALGTSLRDENAYAHHSDRELGLSVIERWSHGFITQYKKRDIHPTKTTLYELMVKPFEGRVLGAHLGVLGDFRELLLQDFFGKPFAAQRAAVASGTSKEDRAILAVQTPPMSTVSPRPENSEVEPMPAKTTSRTEREDSPFQGQASREPTPPPPLEPTDYSFGMLVGGLMFLVVSASRFGKSDDEDAT